MGSRKQHKDDLLTSLPESGPFQDDFFMSKPSSAANEFFNNKKKGERALAQTQKESILALNKNDNALGQVNDGQTSSFLQTNPFFSKFANIGPIMYGSNDNNSNNNYYLFGNFGKKLKPKKNSKSSKKTKKEIKGNKNDKSEKGDKPEKNEKSEKNETKDKKKRSKNAESSDCSTKDEIENGSIKEKNIKAKKNTKKNVFHISNSPNNSNHNSSFTANKKKEKVLQTAHSLNSPSGTDSAQNSKNDDSDTDFSTSGYNSNSNSLNIYHNSEDADNYEDQNSANPRKQSNQTTNNGRSTDMMRKKRRLSFTQVHHSMVIEEDSEIDENALSNYRKNERKMSLNTQNSKNTNNNANENSDNYNNVNFLDSNHNNNTSDSKSNHFKKDNDNYVEIIKIGGIDKFFNISENQIQSSFRSKLKVSDSDLNSLKDSFICSSKETKDKFQIISKSVDNLEKKFSSMKTQINSTANNVNEAQQKISQIQRRMRALNESMCDDRSDSLFFQFDFGSLINNLIKKKNPNQNGINRKINENENGIGAKMENGFERLVNNNFNNNFDRKEEELIANYPKKNNLNSYGYVKDLFLQMMSRIIGLFLTAALFVQSAVTAPFRNRKTRIESREQMLINQQNKTERNEDEKNPDKIENGKDVNDNYSDYESNESTDSKDENDNHQSYNKNFFDESDDYSYD